MNVAIAEVEPDGNLERCVKCQLLPAARRRSCAIMYINRRKKLESRGRIISTSLPVVPPSLEIEGAGMEAGKKWDNQTPNYL